MNLVSLVQQLLIKLTSDVSINIFDNKLTSNHDETT